MRAIILWRNVFMIYTLTTSKAMYQLGALFAKQIVTHAIFFLKGELGTGKTTFSRGFIQIMSPSTHVKSPTYTLIELYTTQRQHILHLDLYRLQDPHELDLIGIRDYTLTPTTWLVEWPDKGLDYLPSPDFILYFTLATHAHQVHIQALTPNAKALLTRLPIVVT